MASLVWTLVLMMGAACSQGQIPTSVWKVKSLDQMPAAHSSENNSIITQCDFEDNSKPFCDWTQMSTDDGDWIRASGPSPMGRAGPSGGYPNGEGYYLHMDSSTIHQSGVVHLLSSPLWEQGPLCVHFAYYMFGLPWGAQLKLLLLMGNNNKHPTLLWKHINTQSPSWMPTTVTVPKASAVPRQLVFEAVRGSPTYLDISLDAISIRRGSCDKVCMMKMCSFDTQNDLCGWSWIPTATGAKWVQKKGSSGMRNVGPKDDFSSPGSGFYMLLDPQNAKPRQKSLLLSHPRQSSGCLSLSFHYILHGQSPGAALTVYASVLGSIQKHVLFSGQSGSNWQPASVNHTGQGLIQFTIVGVFGKIPEPAVAVDAISIAPCGEILPRCDFEDAAHPFCDWVQTSGNGGHWTRGGKNMSIQGTGPFGGSLNRGNYIYLEANKLSQVGQSFRLVSQPFCALGATCMKFSYHMYGLGEGTRLKLLLQSPAGSPPASLWQRIGSQSPGWLNASITIPSGYQQPMQLTLEAIRGTSSSFVVALGFILINHGTCQGPVPTMLPSNYPVPYTGPSEILLSTGKPMAPTEKPTVPTQKPMVPTRKPTVPTRKPTLPTEKPTVHIEKPTVHIEKPTVHIEKPIVHTEKPTVHIEKPTLPTEKPTVHIEKPTLPTEKPTVHIEKPTVHIEKPIVHTEKPIVHIEKPTVHIEKPIVHTEKPIVHIEKPTVHIEKPTVHIEKPIVHTENPTVHTEKPMVHIEKPIVSTEKPIVHIEKPIVPTEKPIVHIEKPIVPTEKPIVHIEKPTVHIEKPTVHIKKPIVPTEKPTVHIEKPIVPTEKPIVHIEKPIVPAEKPIVHIKKPTVHIEKPTVHIEKPIVHIEKPTVHIKRPTIPTTSVVVLPTTTVITVLTKPVSTPSTSITTVTPRPTPASCPSNAHYEPCACPASCQNPNVNCKLVCKPGCVCNSGFLFSDSHCINASSCKCFHDNNYYKTGAEWFGPNCTEHCRCWPGSQTECQTSQCGKHTVCQLKNGQYGCHPHGTATCFVYGDPHYFTFDGRHFSFMGKCTYILAQLCGNSTEPFFRVAAKNEERGHEDMSCLSEIYVTLPETTITLLRGRRTLVEGQQVTLPVILSNSIFVTSSGRFVELQTAFGLRVRWDGDQQLFMSVPSTYYGKLCGFCGNYDGDSSNDNQMPDGRPARDAEELGNSWQTAEDTDKKCQKNKANPPSCDSALQNTLSRPEFCGRIIVSHGAFERCLPHLMASFFFNNCVLDMCKFQGLQQMLCAHMAALTATCQNAGYMVKPWRQPRFCALDCPPNSTYTMCAKLCPDTCHSKFSGMSCQNRCVEGCECNPGFILSGLQCVPQSQCGCLDSTGRYLTVGQQWYEPDCRQLCVCEGNNKIRCVLWRCQAQEVCSLQDGIYGCHAKGSATCTVSGDPHYLTFDGALYHFMGTCSYILTKLCWLRSFKNYFVVSTTNEFRDGNLEVSYVKAVHIQVFNLRISLIKGHKVVLNGRRVTLPVWPAQGRVSIRPSGSFILFYTDFGLQVRYDGNHLVKVTVPSTYAGRLCGLCGNYNNNSLDDDLKPDRKPAGSSIQLGVAWKSDEYSESGCFFSGGKPPKCQGNEVTETWNKNCNILIDHLGPFSQCHKVVSPDFSFASCVHGQCGTNGDVLTLCRSLQAYASLCAQAGQTPAWRNSTFCPLKCPSGSSYSTCTNPCPATCLSLNTPRDCPAALPCAEGCECQKGHVLSGTSCVPYSQCGCTDPQGSYHPVGESWYTDNTCSRLCSCSIHNNISCLQTSCKPTELCGPLEGLIRCSYAGMGVCRISDNSHYVSFDGSYHAIRNTCTYVLAKTCHFTMELPFFKISGENGETEGQSPAFDLRQVNINIFDSLITLQKDHRVLINGKQVILPSNNQIRGVTISVSGIYTMLRVYIGLQIKFDDSGFLEIEIPRAYYGKVCGLCGNFNGEEEDELMMPNDELAQNDSEFVDSWQDKEANPNCQQDNEIDEQMRMKVEHQETLTANCRQDHLERPLEQCQEAFQSPVWTKCAAHVAPTPFLLNCMHNLCEFSLNRALCESLQAFGAACQAQGLKPPIWRNSSFCPLECPTHSTYTPCVQPCSPSCWDPKDQCEDTTDPSSCEEGCICQPGYVLSEQQCVLRTQCGCRDAQGDFLPAGKTWLSSDCTQSCTCRAGGIQCQPFTCPSGSHCKTDASGNSRCIAPKWEQCSVFGDPHYRTFDGLSYRFQGRMTYILIKTVDMLPSGMAPLVVEGRNKIYMPLSQIFLHEIIVMVYGYTVQLQAELQLVVNNQKMDTPFNPSKKLQVSIRGHRLYLITDFELVVSFDGRDNAVISLPSTYQGLVCGLCGNFDKNIKNEFMLPNGVLTENLNYFGNSWEVKIKGGNSRFSRSIQEEEAGEEKSDFDVSECHLEQLELINSTQACRVLVDPQGPFAACHQIVAPEPFQEHCMFDLCVTRDPKEQEKLRCQILSGWVTAL
uniref:Zonadhesin n=1 Tax=Molossus molossus TaxID=27622 RepID=A0A7J8J5W0_MOLMO|nr:zonadhesin [Molossus molossus]